MKPVKNMKTIVKKLVAPAVARQEASVPKPAAPSVAKPAIQTAAPAVPAVPVVARQETPTIKPIAAVRPVTVIEAKIDVGFGNHLFVRGQGAGLSWERGTPLTCVGPDTWRLAIEASDRLKFKLLLNDRVWASGEDVVASPGKQVEVKPAFSE